MSFLKKLRNESELIWNDSIGGLRMILNFLKVFEACARYVTSVLRAHPAVTRLTVHRGT